MNRAAHPGRVPFQLSSPPQVSSYCHELDHAMGMITGMQIEHSATPTHKPRPIDALVDMRPCMAFVTNQY